MKYLLTPLAALLALWAPSAGAAELVWEGHFRTRARTFNSLSLSDSNDNIEGPSMAWDNRLRLQPGFLLSDHVAVYTQIDLLPFTMWGDQAVTTDPFTGDDVPVAYSQRVTPPTDSDGGSTLGNISVTRAWAEITTDKVRVRFGRMPVEWGSGMVWNAGNDPESEYGDTADRVQITGKAGPVYVLGAYELPYEGIVNQRDDLHSLVGGVVYQTETAALGTYNVYRWSNNKDDDTKFSAYIGDIWGKLQLGAGSIDAEFAAVIGSGDLDSSTNDIRITAFGAQINGGLPLDKFRLGLMAGFAGGDADDTDSNLHTFSFDPDFNVALLMFEEPLPTLEASSPSTTNGGRDYDATLTWDGVSNALYLKPRAGYQFMDNLAADVSLLAATHARLPEDYADQKGYGLEVDADIYYEPFTFFSVHGTAGVMLPGKFYSEYEHETLGGGFDAPAFGARVIGAVKF